uniref:non-specific serine/threonine protein kinase n=1 Tax=Meloidogyne hapla TaxID=6305 RepID=A0A1I8AXF2_MELHA
MDWQGGEELNSDITNNGHNELYDFAQIGDEHFTNEDREQHWNALNWRMDKLRWMPEEEAESTIVASDYPQQGVDSEGSSYNAHANMSGDGACDDALIDGSMDNDQPPLGSDDEEQEDPKDYRRGGYHPVRIGDVFKNGRYHVIRKLGWGHFSTVWLCWDIESKRFIAMKIVKSAEHYTEAALDEIKLLECVRDSDPSDMALQRVVQLLDHFTVSGVNGVHVCMVFEVLGCNLLKLILKSDYQGLPIPMVKKIIKQVLEGLHYLHEKCQIIHTDIKPENVLITMSPEEVKKLAEDAILAGKTGKNLSGSAICSSKRCFQKMEESMTKSKKKKLKKKRRRHRNLLEQQLKEIEGMSVDVDSLDSGQNQFLSTEGQLNSSAFSSTERDPDNSETTTGHHFKNEDSNDDEQTVNEQKSANLKIFDEIKIPRIYLNQFAQNEKEGMKADNKKELKEEKTGESRREENQTGVNGNNFSNQQQEKPNDKKNSVGNKTLPENNQENNKEKAPQETEPKRTGKKKKGNNAKNKQQNLQQETAKKEKRDESPSPPINRDEKDDLIEGEINPKNKNDNPKKQSVNTKQEQNNQLFNGELLKNEKPTIEVKEEFIESPQKDISEENETIAKTKKKKRKKKKQSKQSLEEEEARMDEPDELESKEIFRPDLSDEAILEDDQLIKESFAKNEEQGQNWKFLRKDFDVKIADLGNACWTHHHFTEDIQTRQYRALEVIIGASYNQAADIWSIACMAFELATGDYLFEPHSGTTYSRDEDHLAHIIELLGSIPPTVFKKGEHWREFFHKVLTQKYGLPFEHARSFASFLLPMLNYEPSERATAGHCLKHNWLKGVE